VVFPRVADKFGANGDLVVAIKTRDFAVANRVHCNVVGRSNQFVPAHRFRIRKRVVTGLEHPIQRVVVKAWALA